MTLIFDASMNLTLIYHKFSYIGIQIQMMVFLVNLKSFVNMPIVPIMRLGW